MGQRQNTAENQGGLADWSDDPSRAHNFSNDLSGFTGANDSALSTNLTRITTYMLAIAVFLCGWTVFKLGGVNLTLSDIFIVFALGLLLFQTKLNVRPFGSLTVYWLSGLVMLLAGLFISTVINGSMDRWFIVAAQYTFAFMLLPMILMGQRQDLAKKLLAFFVLGIVVSQIIGISASFVWDHKATSALFGSGFLTGNGRIGSLSGEANRNGAMIAFAFPMLLYCIRDGVIPKGLGLICVLILSWGLLASGSFTAFTATSIATIVYFFLTGIKQLAGFLVLAIVGIFLFIASGLPLPDVFQERVAGALSTGNIDEAGTFTGRADLIAEAWQLLDTNMIIGLGVDQYRLISAYGAPVHELHLLIWNEGGLLAFVGLLVLLIILVGTVLLALRRSPAEGALMAAIVAVFMIYTFAITHAYSRAWIMPVFLALGTYFVMVPRMSLGQRAGDPNS